MIKYQLTYQFFNQKTDSTYNFQITVLDRSKKTKLVNLCKVQGTMTKSESINNSFLQEQSVHNSELGELYQDGL